MAVFDKLKVPSTPSVIPELLRTFIPSLVVLIASDLKNFPAATSTPEIFRASALAAVPNNLGRKPPENNAVIVGSIFPCSSLAEATLIPALNLGKPIILTLGVKLSLLIIATAISAM